MTTIKLKNGSGAPTAGDLVQGEPALDLTNKRLYTENASGTVIEVGTNPTSITTGTITGSGDMAIDTNTLFVDVSANSVGIGTSSLGSGEGKLAVLGSNGTGGNGNTLLAKFGGNSAVQNRALQLTEYSVSGINNVGFDFNAPGAGSQAAISFSTLSAERMRVTSAGKVGIGITNPAYNLVVSSGGASGIEFGPAYSGTANLIQHYNRSGAAYVDAVNIAGKHRFAIGATEAMRIDSSGRVGIGTSSPSSVLTVAVDDATGDNGARIAGVTDGNKQLRLAYNTTGNYANIQAIHAGTAYTNLVLQKDGGNVGVGTASPTNAKLEVVAASGEVFRADASGGAYRIVADQTGVALNGNVGIGTTSPAQTLHVSSSSAGSNGIRISNSECSYEARVDGGEFYLYDVDDARIPLLINTSGNVGIGITNPSNPLTVSGSAGTIASFTNGADADLLVKAQSSVTTLTPTTGTLAFGTSSTERMRLDSSGNVLVGKSSSAFGTAGVEINQNGVAGKVFMTRSGGDPLSLNRLSTDGEIQGFYKDGTQVGSIGTGSGLLTIGTGTGNLLFENALVAPCSNSSLGASDGVVDLGASTRRFKDLYLSNAAYLDKVIGHDDTNTYISFIGSDVTQFVQGGAEAMRLNASGDLLLGVSSLTDSAYHLQTDTGGSTGAQINTVSMGRSGSGYPIIGYNCAPTSTVGTYNKHYVDYASWIQFISGRIDTYTTTTTASGTTTGTAGPYLSSGGTSWTSSSDRRLKDNIEGISYGLEAVKLLNPVSYVRNDRDTGATELGFIAQEVDEVVSEVVSVKDDGYYGIDYERLIPVLTKAIQDQQDIIENLKSRIEQLEGAN